RNEPAVWSSHTRAASARAWQWPQTEPPVTLTAVGARPIRARAEVFDPERPAGERVNDGAVARAVSGQHAFDLDPVAAEEGDRAAQEACRGRTFLVGEHLDVGEPGRVVDGDVDELPA